MTTATNSSLHSQSIRYWMHYMIAMLMLLSGLTVLGSSYATEVYKCKTADGSINFQQVPCGEKAASVKINKSSTASSKKKSQERKVNQQSVADQLHRERMIKKQQKRKKDAKKSHAKRNCTGEKDKLTRLMKTDKIYKIDKNGQRVYLNQHQRRQAINKQRQRAEYWCNMAGR